jgi:type II secretory pathway pseudopilin PulG
MVPRRLNRRGFNLVETVVASVILSGAVLTVGAVSTRSLTGARLNRQYEVAAALIDRQFSLIDYMGIDQFIEQGQVEGVFEEFEPGYRWEVSTQYQDIDNLYLVRITVSWVERNRPYSISVETMLNGMGMLIGTFTESQ